MMPDKNFELKGFSSAAIHAGHVEDPNYAHQTPIYASSTYVFDTAEQGMRGLVAKKKDISIPAGAIPQSVKPKEGLKL